MGEKGRLGSGGYFMAIIDLLKESFPVLGRHLLLDEQILDEPFSLMLKTELSCSDILPYYMLWCVKNPESLNTVSDGTLNAISEYGRCKNKENQYLNFKYCCNKSQLKALISFLQWFETNYDFYDDEQFKRTLKRWQSAQV